jgi:type II secretory pathway predicted ATPase ExeA
LRVIAEDLGLVSGGLARHEVVHALHEYLVRQLAADCTVCIIIDEAQNLSADALEELRMISNLETEREKLVQLILLGQPGLRETMGLPRLKQLRQRVAVQFHLEPLTRGETFGYIAHRLKKAGPKRKVRFPRAVMDEVWRYSGGVPRVINTLCDSALLSGFTQRTTKITRRMVREASRDLDLAPQHGGLAQFFKFW